MIVSSSRGIAIPPDEDIASFPKTVPPPETIPNFCSPYLPPSPFRVNFAGSLPGPSIYGDYSRVDVRAYLPKDDNCTSEGTESRLIPRARIYEREKEMEKLWGTTLIASFDPILSLYVLEATDPRSKFHPFCETLHAHRFRSENINHHFPRQVPRSS